MFFIMWNISGFIINFYKFEDDCMDYFLVILSFILVIVI